VEEAAVVPPIVPNIDNDGVAVINDDVLKKL
jgi:hypothetical protein